MLFHFVLRQLSPLSSRIQTTSGIGFTLTSKRMQAEVVGRSVQRGELALP